MTNPPTQRGGVTLPPEFAETLMALKKLGDPRLPATLKAAYEAGWTYKLLAHALGVSQERPRQIAKRASGSEHGPIPDIPAAPESAPRKPTTRRPPAIELTPGEAAQLRELAKTAREESGSTTPDGAPVDLDRIHAETIASLKRWYALHDAVFDHWTEGAPMEHLAEILDVPLSVIRGYVAKAQAEAAKKQPPAPAAPVAAATAASYAETIRGAGEVAQEREETDRAKRASVEADQARAQKFLTLCQRRFLKPLNDAVDAEHEGERWYRCTKCRKKVLRDAVNPYAHRCF